MLIMSISILRSISMARSPVMTPPMTVAMTGVWVLGWMVAKNLKMTPSLAMA